MNTQAKNTSITFMFVSAFVAAALTTASARAQFTPPALPVGSQYQLLFATAGTMAATSSNIADYNAFVNTQATLNPDLPPTTWRVIGSTATANAIDNAPSYYGVDIYNIDGQVLFSDAPSLTYPWSNSIYASAWGPFYGIPDQFNDDVYAFASYPWTGTQANGTAAPNNGALGQSYDPVYGYTLGGGGVLGEFGWLYYQQSYASPATFGSTFYAISAPITVGPPLTSWKSALGGNWSDATNWSAGVPDSGGTGAVINCPTTAAVTITLNQPVTLGTLRLGNSGSAGVGYTIAGSGSNALTFKYPTLGASIFVTDGAHVINAPVILDSDLTVSSAGPTPWTLTFGTASSITDHGGGCSLTMSAIGDRLVLCGNTSYSGSTVVVAGTLALSTSGNNNIPCSSSIVVGKAGTLDVSGAGGAGGFQLAAGQSLGGYGTVVGPVTIGSGASLAPANAGSSWPLSILNSLTLAGSCNFNVYLGGYDQVDLGGGSLTYGGTLNIYVPPGCGPDASATYTLFSGIGSESGTFGSISGLPMTVPGYAWSFDYAHGQLDFAPAPHSWSANVGSATCHWSDASNWSGGVPHTLGDWAVFGSGSNPTIDLSGGTETVSILSFASSDVNYTIMDTTGKGSLVLEGTGYGSSSGSVTVASGSHTINAAVLLQSDLAVNLNGTLTFGTAGRISDNGGGYGLTLGGAGGTLILSGNNSYSGGTTINSCVLQAVDGVGLPSASNLVFSGNLWQNGIGAVFQSSGTFSRALGTCAGQVQWASDGGFAAHGGKLTVQLVPLQDIDGNPVPATSPLVWANDSGTSTVVATAGFVCDGSVLTFGSSSADSQVDFTNGIDLNGEIRQIDVAAGVGGDSALLSGNIIDSQGGGGLLKTGAGELVLSGSNNFAGGITVADGTLVLSTGQAIADGSSLTVGDASLFAGAIPDLAASGITRSSVPEPSTLALCTAAVCGATVYQRLRSRRKKQ